MGAVGDIISRIRALRRSQDIVDGPDKNHEFGKATIHGKLADQLGIAGPVDSELVPQLFAEMEALRDDRPQSEPRYYLRRDDGGFAVGIEVDDLIEAKELAQAALSEDAEVELHDQLTGVVTRGQAILDL